MFAVSSLGTAGYPLDQVHCLFVSGYDPGGPLEDVGIVEAGTVGLSRARIPLNHPRLLSQMVEGTGMVYHQRTMTLALHSWLL